jgi:hypothetical protein
MSPQFVVTYMKVLFVTKAPQLRFTVEKGAWKQINHLEELYIVVQYQNNVG